MAEYELNLETLFCLPVMPPFSYRIEIQSDSPEKLLGELLILGSRQKFNKSLNTLSLSEIDILRGYFHSFGWDADFTLDKIDKEVVDYKVNGDAYIKTLTINNWRISFKPYKDHSSRR